MSTNRSFWRSGHWPTLLGAFLYFDVSFMIWVLLGALGNHIAGQFGLGPAQKGLMTAVPILSGSLLRLAFGAIADAFGAKRTALLGMAITLAPLLAGWLWAESIREVYLVGVLLGVAGASFAVAMPMASRCYPPEHQGLALGIAGAGNSGTIFATLLAPRLAEAYGWQAVFGLAIVPLALVGMLVAVLTREPPRPARAPVLAEYAALLRERDTYLFCLFYGVSFGGFVGLVSFLPIVLRDQYAVSPVRAGDLTTLCVLAGSGLRPVGGWLADKLGGIRMLMGLYALIAVLMTAIAQLPPLTTAVALLMISVGLLGMGNGSVFQLVPQRFAGRVGIVTGLVGAAGGVGGFFLPTMIGWLKQTTGSYGPGLGLFAAAAALALVTTTVAQRRWVGLWMDKNGRAPAPVLTVSRPETA
jgi:NNP family nitrate/nitrite transporter-like MFS transporter